MDEDYLHVVVETDDTVKGRFLLDVVVRQSANALK